MKSCAKSLPEKYLQLVDQTPVDHWRPTADGGLAFTDDGWLKTEDEQFYINSDGSRTPVSEGPIPGLTIGAEGIETGLLNILANSSDQKYETFGQEEQQAAHDMLANSGFASYLKGSEGNLGSYWWDAKNEDGEFVNAGRRIGSQMLAGYDLPGTSNSGLLNGGLHRLFANMGFGSVTERVAKIGNGLEQNASSLWGRITAPRQQDRPGLFGRINNAWDRLWGNESEIINDQYANATRVANSPAGVMQFWADAMNPAVAAQYQADERGQKCNQFVCDTLRNKFSQEFLDHVFPNGLQSANLMAIDLENNENLTRLEVNSADDLREIQRLANPENGYLVLMAYQNPDWIEGTYPSWGEANGVHLSGHLGFVAPEGLNLFSFPQTGVSSEYIGLNGMDINFNADGPIMVQAGSFTGVVPTRLATNGWRNKFDEQSDLLDFIRFYLVENF